ncbi:MAG: hypothetical protein N3A58_06490 [Spirochaetes bacterium]|nr:hypothetical protein [Spirochaetota bacterium]
MKKYLYLKKFNKNKFFNLVIFSFIIIFSLLILPFHAYSANLDIPYVLFISKYNIINGLSNYFYIDFSISGGLKYNILLNFYYLSTETNPGFKLSLITTQIKDIFNILNISIFHGLYKKIFEGPYFMSPIYTLEFLTPNYLNNFQYNFIIYGSGVDLNFNIPGGIFNFSIIGYLKNIFINDYSIDIYLIFNIIENLKFEIFGGTDKFSIYRLGGMIYFDQDFFNIKLNIGTHNLLNYQNIYDLYISFEQKINLEQFSQSFVIFSKPSFFNNQNISDYSKITFSLTLAYNNIYKTLHIGVLSKLLLDGFALNEVYVVPFIKLLSGGILFNINANFQFINTSNYFESITISCESSF